MKENIKNLYSVSFITCTFNSQKIIKECLDSINKLDYPKDLIEVIIVDGGSKDKTLEIVKNYSFCRIITENTGRPEAATAIGYNKAKNDLIVNFPSDNVILKKEWLRKMVRPFEDDAEIVASETLYYSYVKSDTLLNRYFSLFGINDPIAYYLNKRDRATHFENKWHLNTESEDKGDYLVTKFNQDNLPTVGANGFIIKRNIIQLVTKEPLKFFHIDACYDLVGMGYDKFAFVKTAIWHKTGEEFSSFVKRKVRYAGVYFRDKNLRRYHLYDPKKDKFNLIIYIFLSLTIIEPLFQSIRGFLKIRDWAWFLHPILCFLTVFLYFYAIIINKFTIKPKFK